MLDMKFVRENPDAVKENIKKKFQDAKLPLVDEVIALDAQRRASSPRGGAKTHQVRCLRPCLPLWGRCPRRGRRGLPPPPYPADS